MNRGLIDGVANLRGELWVLYRVLGASCILGVTVYFELVPFLQSNYHLFGLNA